MGSAGVKADTCMVCGSKVADIKHPDTNIIAFCNTFGVHVAKTDDNVVMEGQTGSIPVVYVDGHVANVAGSISQFCQMAETRDSHQF